MDLVKPKSAGVGGLVQTFTKVLRLRAAGVAPEDRIRKIKFAEIISADPPKDSRPLEDEEMVRHREAMEALFAKLFASISAIKAAYAELQTAQSPYDPEIIQSQDEAIVSELRSISELKHCYLKKQILPSQESLMVAEIQEQKNLLKTFEIMSKKLQSQLQVKDSEIFVLREKLQESQAQNSSVEKRLNPNSALFVLDNLHLSALNPNHFITVLQHATKSIHNFVKLMTEGMESAAWDLEEAANSIEPGVAFAKPSHRVYAFESYVFRKMFSDFQHPSFSQSSSKQKHQRRKFFDSFMELKGVNPLELVLENPASKFGKFCRLKYLGLVHPRMETAFFGDTTHRSIVSSGGFPRSAFFTTFVEMAKRVWLLHRLAFSFEPEACIFQVRSGCRFSEVFMESACDDSPDIKPRVGFTVAPGFRIGKTVIQCKVYLVAGSGASVEG
ncbi:protein GRAVITROPIC IN THE LIGHT 1-like [Aristolochia californica]|uniref:protein GRAVITROPIC IN THE LIGHT 1-like n=1 Tax=Aristolochia californica TaxID=171875 RepID=UPI0035DDB4E8